MVMNSWKEGGASNLPWMHPEVTDAVRDAITLRYTLMPYLWQCFEQASERHSPIIRPTFFNFPDDVRCLDDSDEFMLGEALLVSPVVEPGQRRKTLYLPQLDAGRAWLRFDTRERFAAGQDHAVETPLGYLPLFVVEGSRIPVSQAWPGHMPRHDDPIAQVLQF
jgi:alpha-glucosidase